MATALALVTVAMAFTIAYAPEDLEVDGVYYLKERDIVSYNEEEYLVLLGTKQYTDDDLNGWGNIYLVSDGSPTSVDGGFRDCTTIENVALSTEIKTLGREAFSGCTNLESAEMAGLVEVGESAFEGSGLRVATLGPDLEVIGRDAFRDCTDLEVFDIQTTRVHTIESGAFQNSGLQIVDIRDVDSLHYTAFSGSDLTLQIVRTYEDEPLAGVDRIYFDGPRDYFCSIGHNNGTVTVTVTGLRYIDVYDENMDRVDCVMAPSGEENYTFTFDVREGMDYSINSRAGIIDFPDDMGLEDVILSDGAVEYVLPENLRLGDLTLESWGVRGLNGTFDRITIDDLIEMSGRIEMVPRFDSTVLRMDHSAVSGRTDVSGLPKTYTFTYGDAYPDLADVYGYEFAGWEVGGRTYQPGDRISDFTEHTAKSHWTPLVFHTLTYTDGHGGTLATSRHPHGSSVAIDSGIVADGIGAELFAGWSVDGATILSDGRVVMDGDIVLKPVFGTRDLLTVTYVVDGTGWDTAQCYECRTFTVDADEPTSDGIFSHWLGSDGKAYRTGDSLILDRGLTMTAVWRERATYELTFVNPHGEGFSDTKVEGIPYEVKTVCDDTETSIFSHWTGSDGVSYGIGDTITSDTPLTLTATFRERATFDVVFSDGGKTLLTDDCLEGHTYTVSIDDPVSGTMIFVGWNGQDRKTYSRGDGFVVTGDTALTAEWREPEIFSVTFMDGTENLQVLQGNEGSTMTVDVDNPSREGKVFLHWTDPDGNTYGKGDGIVLMSDITLTAEWRDALTFTITFTVDGETVHTQQGLEGTDVAIDAEGPVSYGKVFQGWSDGEATYWSGDDILLLSDVTLTAMWRDAMTFTLSFTVDGEIVYTQEGLENTEVTISAEDPVSYGKVFLGWTDGTASYMSGDGITMLSDITLNAVWRDALTFTVSFEVDGETVSTLQGLENTEAVIDIADPVSEGRIFLGWSDGENTYQSEDSVLMLSDITLDAVWRDALTFTVSYVVDVETVSTAQGLEQSEFKISVDDPVSYGKVFLGWSDGSGTYRSGDGFTLLSNVTLTAVWRDCEIYTVSYVLEGETIHTTEGFENTTIVIDATDPVSDGRVFLGWNDGNTTYNQGDSVLLASDVTLTAQWRDAMTFTITYIVDGEKFSSQQGLEGSVVTISVGDPVSEGKIFLDWSDGTATYHSGDSITMLSDVTLEALWRDAMTFTVSFDVDGSIVSTQQGLENTEITISVDDPASYGKVFLGWSDGRETFASGDLLSMTSDITLVAKWRDCEVYTVTFVADGKTVHTYEGFENTKYVIDTADPVSEGRVFLEWSDGSAAYQSGDSVLLVSDLTLTAEWRDAMMLTITFSVDGETVQTQQGLENTKVVIDCADPESSGRIFLGWTDGTSVYASGDGVTMLSDITLEAVWRDALTLTVTFTDGGDTLYTEKGLEGTDFTISVDDPVSETMIFVVWLCDGTEYRSGDIIRLTTDLTMEAVWREPTFSTVTFVSEGAEVGSSDVREDRTLVLDLVPERDGHELVGWSTTDDGSVDHAPGAEIEVDGDMTLYAVWKALTPEPDGDSTDPTDPDGTGNSDAPTTGREDAGNDPDTGDDTSDKDDAYIPDPPTWRPGGGWTDRPGTNAPSTDEEDDAPITEPPEEDPPSGEPDDGVTPTEEPTVPGEGSEALPSGSRGDMVTAGTIAAAVCALTAAIVVLVVIMRRS